MQRLGSLFRVLIKDVHFIVTIVSHTKICVAGGVNNGKHKNVFEAREQ
jgi:hypothetical protein